MKENNETADAASAVPWWRRWWILALAGIALAAGVVAWLVVAGQHRQAHAAAISEYEAAWEAYQVELAEVKDEARTVEGQVGECREAATSSPSRVEEHQAICEAAAASIQEVLAYPDAPGVVLDDLEGMSTGQIEAAADALTEAIADVDTLAETTATAVADIEQVIAEVTGEVKDTKLIPGIDTAKTAVASARGQIEQTPAGVVEQHVLDDLATKTGELEAFVADVEARIAEIDWEEAASTHATLNGLTGEVNDGAARLEAARAEYAAAQAAPEPATHTRSTGGSRQGTGGQSATPRNNAPAPQPAPVPQPAPAPQAPSGGGWIESGDIIVDNESGEGICGDEFGNTWDC